MKSLKFILTFFLIGVTVFIFSCKTKTPTGILTLGNTENTAAYPLHSKSKKVDYSKILNKIAMLSTAPPGFTLVSSTTEYLFDDLGPSIVNLDFTTFAVKFGTCNLGTQSYVEITSVQDGLSQQLNTQTLAEWRNVSAMFNGEYAKVEVFQHNSESGISCPVERLITTEISSSQKFLSPPCTAGSICGNTAIDDLDRIPSSHEAIAHRFGGTLSTNPNFEGFVGGGGGGTVWLTSNGAFASAGHVVGTTELFQQIHFNTSASLEDGAPVVPSPDDQYAIDFSSISRSYGGSDGDWSVFKVFPNPNTGLLPQEVQTSFLRVGKDNIPSTGFKYGHGTDVFPSGTCGSLNSANRTQQRATATSISYPSSSWGRFNWSGVNEGGDSGSPIVTTISSVEVAVGSNTNCSSSNWGTSFKNTNFANALNNIYGTTINYVDGLHPSTIDEGNIVRPYKTIVDGVSGATNYETLSIVEGSYDETITITKPLTLSAPVGTVIIGSSGSPKIVVNPDAVQAEESEDEKPQALQLAQNYPNPFNPSTIIEFNVPELTNVSLKVYNSVGQEIATLVNESKQPGNYSVNFNASEFASGVYFYVLRAGSTELIKRMTLIK